MGGKITYMGKHTYRKEKIENGDTLIWLMNYDFLRLVLGLMIN